MKNKVFILSLLGLFALTTVKAQVMWDFRGAINYGNAYGSYDDTKKINFWGELGMDIPLKEKFAIEFALRYRNEYHADKYLFEEYEGSSYEYDKAYWTYDGYGEGRAQMLELPVRLGYKIPIFKNTLIRISAGPYVSASLDRDFSIYQAGVSSIVTYEYKRVNIGLNYNWAIHKPFERCSGNGIYLTLGVKFKSSAWKSIGKAAAVVGGAALVVGSAVAATQGGGSENIGTSDSYAVAETVDADDGDNSKAREENKQLRKKSAYMTGGSYSNDDRAYSGYEDQLNDMKLNPERYTNLSESQYKNKAKDIQRKMKTIRERIVKNGGTKPMSELERWALNL